MTTKTADEELVGIGELVKVLGLRPHRISYLLASRSVQYARRIGNNRLYPRASTLKLLRRELADIKTRKPGPRPAA